MQIQTYRNNNCNFQHSGSEIFTGGSLILRVSQKMSTEHKAGSLPRISSRQLKALRPPDSVLNCWNGEFTNGDVWGLVRTFKIWVSDRAEETIFNWQTGHVQLQDFCQEAYHS